MRTKLMLALAAGLLLGASFPADALQSHYLQCVPYAREASGIALRGDAWTWWTSAAGLYERGVAPRQGAVLVFKRFGAMQYGHVAVVTKTVGSRELQVAHANWGGSKGRVTTRVEVIDVSPNNDWSEVRVWNIATRELGTRTYPTYGFIYAKHPHPAPSPVVKVAAKVTSHAKAASHKAVAQAKAAVAHAKTAKAAPHHAVRPQKAPHNSAIVPVAAHISVRHAEEGRL